MPGTTMDRLPLKHNSTGQGLLLATLALLALGVVMVHSAVASVANPGFAWYNRTDIRHTIFAAFAAMLLLVFWVFDYRWLSRAKWRLPILPTVLLVLAVASALLLLIPFTARMFGYSVGGKFRWIRLGPAQYSIGFQPSEVIKLALVIFLAAWLTHPKTNVRSFLRTFLPAMLVIGLCVGVVVKNDLGAAAIIGLCALATLLLAGVPWYYLILLAPGVWAGWQRYVVNDPEHWKRIAAMLDPWDLANKSSYQPRESLLAVLTGGWFGKGPGNGSIKLGHLPESSTDFIFAVYCEEWGFVGAALLIGLLGLWIWLARKSAVRSADAFGRTLAGSLGFLIAVQAILHIAVVLVTAPPTGITLPFISAGGTALVLMAWAAALMVSVTSRRSRDGGLAPSRSGARAPLPSPAG